MIVVDIAADLNDEDDTGLIWTFLDEARNPAIVVPGAIVSRGTRTRRRSPRWSTSLRSWRA